MPNLFSGTLNPNLIYKALVNFVISQKIFVDPIAKMNDSLLNAARREVGQYGDKVLATSTDLLETYDMIPDTPEALNLLQVHRPKDIKQEEITIDKIRQAAITTSAYITKRAFLTPESFSEFTSMLVKLLNTTQKVFSVTTFNTYIGTMETNEGKQQLSITLPIEEGNTEATNRLQAQTIAKSITDLFVDLSDPSRDYNDFGFMRSYDKDDMFVVYNSDYASKILKIDTPNLYHNTNLVPKLGENTLPSKYFGTINVDGGTTSGANITIRSLIETDYTVGDKKVHVIPGELLPNDVTYEARTTYTEDPGIIAKIYSKDAVNYLESFKIQSSFTNPKNLNSTNYYLSWSYGIGRWSEKPFITVRGRSAE